MTLPLLILRPIDGALQTAIRAEKLQLTNVVDPLFFVEPIDWQPPSVEKFDAVMFTSANALRFSGAKLALYSDLPALVVGDATASAAKDHGFKVAVRGDDGAMQLLKKPETRKYSRILRLTGEHYTAIKSDHHQIVVCPVYRSAAMELGPVAQRCLRRKTVILLHSARAAKTLALEIERLEIARSKHRIAALSEAVATIAGDGWKNIVVAPEPNDDALLRVASRLCHEGTIEEPE